MVVSMLPTRTTKRNIFIFYFLFYLSYLGGVVGENADMSPELERRIIVTYGSVFFEKKDGHNVCDRSIDRSTAPLNAKTRNVRRGWGYWRLYIVNGCKTMLDGRFKSRNKHYYAKTGDSNNTMSPL